MSERALAPPALRVRRLSGNPIIGPELHESLGVNIQGPSLIRVPEWIPEPLGRYYLYFADHKGAYIRMAFADALEGPWRVHVPGTLQLAQSHFLTEPAAVPEDQSDRTGLGGWARSPVAGVPSPLESATKPHIASPDVHVREDLRAIVMYFHGLEAFRLQPTRVALSRDGLHFEARAPLLAHPYLRAFRHREHWYALAMPGVFYRSHDGLSDFEHNPLRLFPDTMRHCAVSKRGDRLAVFWSRVGDEPEHILRSMVDLRGDWSGWRVSDPVSVLRPEQAWEGADCPSAPSVRDAINVRVRQLRDPAIFEEEGRQYLLYAVAGEAGIALAELDGLWPDPP